MDDLISRQKALEFTVSHGINIGAKIYVPLGDVTEYLRDLPSAQPTLYGYPVEHLAMIATVLRKENLPPEKIADVLTDIGRIVAMVRDEFEESLRKAVEQCQI